MANINISQLREFQRKISSEITTEDSIEELKLIAGFDTAIIGDKIIAAAVVLDAKTLEIVEKVHAINALPMQYIPGYRAFREGPIILEAFYDLEHDPDVLMINGNGILHPAGAGLANYVGVELNKPTIGVAKKLLTGEIKDGKIMIAGEERGVVVETRKYANPLFVSPGNMISIAKCAEIVKNCIIPPHKLPEPLHQAHKYAKKAAEKFIQPAT